MRSFPDELIALIEGFALQRPATTIQRRVAVPARDRGWPAPSHATVADENGVALRFRARGTRRGDFMAIPATGRPINVVGTAIVWIENGKATSLRERFDRQTLMQQISTAPS